MAIGLSMVWRCKMLVLLGFNIPLPPALSFLASKPATFLLNLAAWFLIALLVNFVFLRLLKRLTRRIPGELEDILLGIVSTPLVLLVLLLGIRSSLHILALSEAVLKWERVVFLTILVLLLSHVLGRLIKEVLVFYGEHWAARTESRLDDVLVPVLNLFGPLVLVTIAALIILPLWGVNVTSVLLGAGVLGLVLGLALQETLGNIFSGITILVEAPFKKHDLILLPDGRTCEVVRLGIRSTTFFSLDEQATIYIPNKVLETNTLVNLTKPTAEQRYSIDIHVHAGSDLARLQSNILDIARGHPALLASDTSKKLEAVEWLGNAIRLRAQRLPAGEPARLRLEEEAARNRKSIEKLALDGMFNQHVCELRASLASLRTEISSREDGGLSSVERQELFCNFISPVENAVERCLHAARAWLEADDPWVQPNEGRAQARLWQKRNEQLQLHWERLKKALLEVSSQRELRLDESTLDMLKWIKKEYKIPPSYWKDPVVSVKELSADSALLQLSYYVDNIRLEHDGRPRRVRDELSRMIHELLQEPAREQTPDLLISR